MLDRARYLPALLMPSECVKFRLIDRNEHTSCAGRLGKGRQLLLSEFCIEQVGKKPKR